MKTLAALVALLALAGSPCPAQEVAPGADPARAAAMASLKASFSAGFPDASGIHPFITGFTDLPPAQQEYVLGGSLDALVDKGIPLATISAVAPKSAEAKLLLGQAAKAVQKTVEKRASDDGPYSDKTSKILQAKKEKDLRDLSDRIDLILPLYRLTASKSSIEGLQKIFHEARTSAQSEKERRLANEAAWDAEALLPGFEPGFHRQEGFASQAKEYKETTALLDQISRNRMSARYDAKLQKRLVKVVTDSKSPELHALAIQRVMDGVYTEPKPSKAFVKNAVETVSKICSYSYSPRVLGLAMALLSRQDGYPPKKMLAKIGDFASWNGRSITTIPTVDSARGAVVAEKISLLKQAKEGVKTHRVAAALAGLKIASMFLPLVHPHAIDAWPLIGLLATVGLMGYIAVKGLFTHHPFSTVAQILLMGSMFKHFRIWAHEPTIVVAVLTLGVAAQAYISLASFKKDQTVPAWILNRALTWPAVALAVALFHWLS